jgi:acyl-CoA reductase-like NAD-dependent aldehyde dehydrogenase
MTTVTVPDPQALAEGRAEDVLPLFVAGRWEAAADGATYESYEPGTGQVWAHVAAAGPPDVDRAVTAARGAMAGPWGSTPAMDRARVLWRIAAIIDGNRDLLAHVESRDNGKLLFFTYTRREPVGVVGAIIPWNSPLNMLAWKVAPALAGGNVVVLKPADETPVSALVLAVLLKELDLPPGVLSILPGIGRITGEAIVDHPGVDKLAFTGSTETGKRIAARAAGTLKPATFELGGKSPNIVFADADLKVAVQRSAYGIFSAGGQSCMAASRTLVHRGVLDEFSERFGTRASAIRVGDPFAERSQVGAQTSERQLRKIESYVGIARDEGAHIVSGGAWVPRRRTSRAAAISSARPCSAPSPMTCASRARRSSGPSRCSFRSTTRTTPSRWPTTPRTGWPPRCGRAMSSVPTVSHTPCRPGRCGSTTTGCGTG